MSRFWLAGFAMFFSSAFAVDDQPEGPVQDVTQAPQVPSISYVTLPDSWPMVAEFTPVTLERMVTFKYACMAYLAGIIDYKPEVNPSVETWIDNHTKLFRRYSISLEARIFGYLNAVKPDDIVLGQLMIGFISRVQELSVQELVDCQTSIINAEQEIAALNASIASCYSQAQEKEGLLIQAKLQEQAGEIPEPTVLAIEAELDVLAQSIAQSKKAIEYKTFLKNEAFVNGISIDWVSEGLAAQTGLLPQAEQDLQISLEANRLDQLALVTRLEFNAIALEHLVASELQQAYGEDLYDFVNFELITKEDALKAQLEQKRIECDQGLLGGIYNPDDYANAPEPSSYIPQQVKMVSFKAFRQAWDEAGFHVATDQELEAWQLNFI